MANLSQSATLADLTSPQGVASFDAFYAGLAIRTAASFKVLHVLATPAKLVSMDFGVASDLELPPVPYAIREWPCRGALCSVSLAELIVMADAKLSLYRPSDIITALPAAEWWKFWIAPFAGMKPGMMPHSSKGRVRVVLRGVVG